MCVQRGGDLGEGIVHIIDHLKQVYIAWGNDSPLDEVIKIDQAVPEFPAVEKDWHFFVQFIGLGKGEGLEEFIHRPKPAGKDHDGLGMIKEVEFTEKEVVKLEGKVGIGIGIDSLLKGQADSKGD